MDVLKADTKLEDLWAQVGLTKEKGGDAILAKGFSTAGELAYSVTAANTDTFAIKIAGLFRSLGEDEADVAMSPLAGQVRRLLGLCHDLLAADKAVASATAPTSAVPSFPPAPGPFPAGGSFFGSSLQQFALMPGVKQQPTMDRCTLEKSFEARYPSEGLNDRTRPSDKLLSLVYSMVQTGEYRWIPWRQLLTMEQADEVSGKRTSKSAEQQLLALMAEAHGLKLEEADEVSSSPWRVHQLLTVRAFAFAIAGGCHLGPLKDFNLRFLEKYSGPPKTGYARTTAAEAEKFDQEVWRDVFQLVRESWSLQDAIVEIAITRDGVRKAFVSTPLLPKTSLGKTSDGKGVKAKRAGEWQDDPSRKKAKGDGGKGDWKKGKGGGKGGKGVCFDFRAGKCHRGEECRFRHSSEGDAAKAEAGTFQ